MRNSVSKHVKGTVFFLAARLGNPLPSRESSDPEAMLKVLPAYENVLPEWIPLPHSSRLANG
jgi:hypothetical protein